MLNLWQSRKGCWYFRSGKSNVFAMEPPSGEYLRFNTDSVDRIPIFEWCGEHKPDTYVCSIATYDRITIVYLVHCPLGMVGGANTLALNGLWRMFSQQYETLPYLLCLSYAKGQFECARVSKYGVERNKKTGAWLPNANIPGNPVGYNRYNLTVELDNINNITYLMEDLSILEYNEVLYAYVYYWLSLFKISVLPVKIKLIYNGQSRWLKVSNAGTPGKPGFAFKIKE